MLWGYVYPYPLFVVGILNSLFPVAQHRNCSIRLQTSKFSMTGFYVTSFICSSVYTQKLASSAGISPDESGGGKNQNFFFKTHSQARTHREACGGGYAKASMLAFEQVHLSL
jgi:hypothetical protein